MISNKDISIFSVLLISLYAFSLLDLSVFGNALGLVGERELTEQFSLIVILSIYFFSVLDTYHPHANDSLLIYLGYTFTSLSFYLSEIGIVTSIARPLFGLVTIGFTLAYIIKRKKLRNIIFFIIGAFILALSTSIDFLLDGAFGYLGEGSHLRKIYLENSTVDLEEIIEPLGYYSFLMSYFFYSESSEVKTDLSLSSKIGIVAGSSIVAAGSSFLIDSYTSLYLFYCISAILVGLVIVYVQFRKYLEYFVGTSYLGYKSVFYITTLVFLFLVPSLKNESDTFSILVLFPFTTYCAYYYAHTHPKIKI
jgi:hypothetical protein